MFLLEDGWVTLEDAGFRDEDSILVEVRHSTEGTWPEEISSVFASATGTPSAGGADRRMSTMRSSTQVAGDRKQKTFLACVLKYIYSAHWVLRPWIKRPRWL